MSKRKTFKQFSKRCLAAMIVLWFLGALFGFFVCTVQILRGDITVGLSDVLVYIGTPMTGGVVSYMIKSAFEDKRKEKKDEGFENEVDKP